MSLVIQQCCRKGIEYPYTDAFRSQIHDEPHYNGRFQFDYSQQTCVVGQGAEQNYRKCYQKLPGEKEVFQMCALNTSKQQDAPIRKEDAYSISSNNENVMMIT